jgi:DNA-binding response OmpR family regulator
MTTILVADDDPDIRELVTDKLEGAGYDVISVQDGASALSMIRSRMPDLAVLDVIMPGMSGFEVCEALRADPTTKRLPVIFMTVRARESDIALGLAIGANDYIAKPFRSIDLISRVQKVLDQNASESFPRLGHSQPKSIRGN